LLGQGASLYEVAKLPGINASTAEEFYSPYCRERQDRGARLVFAIRSLEFVTENFDSTQSEKVVTFCAPLSSTLGRFGQQAA